MLANLLKRNRFIPTMCGTVASNVRKAYVKKNGENDSLIMK